MLGAVGIDACRLALPDDDRSQPDCFVVCEFCLESVGREFEAASASEVTPEHHNTGPSLQNWEDLRARPS